MSTDVAATVVVHAPNAHETLIAEAKLRPPHEAAELLARLAAGPPIALAQSKRLLNNAIGATLEQALDEEGAAQTVNFATKDTAEAVSAFLEKRDPTFQGR